MAADSTTPGSIAGVVVSADTRLPMGGAVFSVDGGTRRLPTDASGAFHLDSLRPGPHSLIFIHIGYNATRVDSLNVTPAVGVRLYVPLTLAVLDGCPGFMVVRERVPWWRWW